MKNTVEIGILNQKYTIKTESDAKHVEKVTKYVNSIMEDLVTNKKVGQVQDAAVLTALNIASDYLKYIESSENQRKDALDKTKLLMRFMTMEILK